MAAKMDQLYNALGMDTFNFWSVAGNEHEQIRLFAEEVVPAVREQIQEILKQETG